MDGSGYLHNVKRFGRAMNGIYSSTLTPFSDIPSLPWTVLVPCARVPLHLFSRPLTDISVPLTCQVTSGHPSSYSKSLLIWISQGLKWRLNWQKVRGKEPYPVSCGPSQTIWRGVLRSALSIHVATRNAKVRGEGGATLCQLFVPRTSFWCWWLIT